MLGIHGVGRQRADYYLSDRSRHLPGSSPNRWVGTGAAGLGLGGPPRPEEFHRLLEGRHPRTGRPMGSGRVAVAGFDLTFSAPKSASVLFALRGVDTARRVVAAHEAAVAGALSYLEQHGVSATRRSGPERTVIPTTGMVAARFTHAVNRNGDPHLHSHVVMANLVHGLDGRWSASDRRGIEAHRQAASAVYEAHLRAGLTSALGVRWVGAPGRTPEIEGVAPELLGEFSSRAADIRRHVYEVGARSARGRQIAWAATRPAKVPPLPYRELADGWMRRAQALGMLPERGLGQVPGRVTSGRALFDEHRFAGLVSLTPHGGVRRRDVVAAFGAAAPGGIAASSLERIVARWVPTAAVGVAEPLHQRGSVVPAPHLVRALGPRPIDPSDHEVWVGAAAAIDAYRGRWGVNRSAEPLGAPRTSPDLASLPTARLADHIRAMRHLDAARSRLGLREPAPLGYDLGR
jgi:conjugative relaxase-like TrwC/TraI family protein